MKNGLPYLSKDRFWEAMEDIAPWPELKETIHEQVQKTDPMIHAVQEIVPNQLRVSYPGRSVSFNPHQARLEIMQTSDANQPKPNSNRPRLPGVAKTLTYGAQTQGSVNGCVSKRTYEPRLPSWFSWFTNSLSLWWIMRFHILASRSSSWKRGRI